MKKITLIIALFFIALQGNSQVLLSQGFDTALTWTQIHTVGTATTTGWSRVTTGTAPTVAPFAGAGMAKFAAYDIASGNSYNLNSTAMTFVSGTAYRVSFQMFRDAGYGTTADRIRVYYNTSATSVGGTLIGTVNRAMNLSPAVTAEGWYNYSFTIPAAANGTGYISLLATSAYGNNMYIDSVSISQIQNDDAQMISLNLPSITATTGNTAITGNFKNSGSNAITSIDLNWQAGNGTIYTQNLTGLNIAPNATYAYSHADQWNATPGAYSIKVWVSNPNGVTDTDVSNNQIIKSVAVASNSCVRLPLYQKFSSATCAPCASFNGTYFNPFYATNENNIALINYQVNWPGNGDPYYNLETGARVSYYSINGAPTLMVDEKDGTNFDAAALQADYVAANAKPAYFLLNSEFAINGTEITVKVNGTPYLSGAYRLHIAVVEKITTGNIATNGETSFHNVMMKMLPNAAGTAINTTYDVPFTTTLTTDLASTFVEDYSDLAVVVFVQDNTNKGILQSGYAVETLLGNNQFETASKIKLYPNPSNGIVKIKTETPVDVVVCDVLGKVVFSMKQVNSGTAMDMSSLQAGMYMARMINGTSEETQKIIIK